MAFFDPGSVIWNIQSTNKFDAIREVIYSARTFYEQNGLDTDEFAELVIQREKLQSTGFGHGVAVAHGRTDKVGAPIVSLGVSQRGIEYEAVDGQPVHLLFVIANHPDHQMNYLRILSTLVGMVRDEPFRRELLHCQHAGEVEQKLCHSLNATLGTSWRSAHA
jgi:PTS system nitrogen regulatory IIA component